MGIFAFLFGKGGSIPSDILNFENKLKSKIKNNLHVIGRLNPSEGLKAYLEKKVDLERAILRSFKTVNKIFINKDQLYPLTAVLDKRLGLVLHESKALSKLRAKRHHMKEFLFNVGELNDLIMEIGEFKRDRRTNEDFSRLVKSRLVPLLQQV